ncbi:hypothetical protein BO71DRAFT_333858 [Aspergillus ellipticus CBS 707.79]|uniref:Ankyrin n=1 Tax=Aspergillus ellipticus CBS 707.79 TaxID=1448320 RepID=A0A319DRH2_9EURO|nr:hypothetical protein BO71DRAFT_333858 [Aspergillus ellipticus CBS 707.79]
MFDAACENPHYGRDIVRLLAKRSLREISVTEERLEAAAGHPRHSYELIRALLDQVPDFPISENIVRAAASTSNGSRAISYLLERRGETLPITQSILERAARCSSLATVKILLKERGQHLSINEAVLEAAVGNEDHGGEILDAKLPEWGQQIPLTERIILATVLDKTRSNTDCLEMLLKFYTDFPITPAVVQNAAANEYWSTDLIELLAKKNREATTEYTKAIANPFIILLIIHLSKNSRYHIRGPTSTD